VHLALASNEQSQTENKKSGIGNDSIEDESGQDDEVIIRLRKNLIRGQNQRQKTYLKKIRDHDISFGIGPAGTGKTYLAVACAVNALAEDEFERILLVRPAVEAGEKLGYLPGDIGQKIDPYLRHEAQNTTVEQMKMFLTRIGFGSKAIVTGDITQVDLPRGQLSGLRHSRDVLSDIKGISFTHFKPQDVVRHPLVQRIVEAYEKNPGQDAG
jgi:phosphate starvation-inducible PhoH-like protein